MKLYGLASSIAAMALMAATRIDEPMTLILDNAYLDAVPDLPANFHAVSGGGADDRRVGDGGDKAESDSDKANADTLGQKDPDKKPSDGTIGQEKGEDTGNNNR